MSGNTGRAVGRHTLLAHRGDTSFAISPAQLRIVKRALAHGGATYVKAGEVRSAEKLVSLKLGELQDDGAFGPTTSSNADGERWTFTVAKGISTSGGEA